MANLKHPREALFEGEKPFPIIPACEHFAGSEKLITKALEMQNKLGGMFDITMDCEDGAQTGKEKEHAEMIVRIQNSDLNKLNMSGVRIHDYTNAHWKLDVDIIVPGAGNRIAYITIPKPTKVSQVAEMIDYIQKATAKADYEKRIEELNEKNTDLKMRLDNFKFDSKEKWESFKMELNQDMEDLGTAISNFMTNDEKKK
jgi:citrate lyase subunit beta/citryl-CoA lyase